MLNKFFLLSIFSSTIVAIINNATKVCSFSGFNCSLNENDYSIICSDETEFKPNITDFNGFFIIKNLKIKGLNNLELLIILKTNIFFLK